MLNWIKCSDRLPNSENSIKNNCLVKTKDNTYFFAYYSIHLDMWRRIEVPHKFNVKKVIDEIIPKEDIVAWVSMDEIKLKEND